MADKLSKKGWSSTVLYTLSVISSLSIELIDTVLELVGKRADLLVSSQSPPPVPGGRSGGGRRSRGWGAASATIQPQEHGPSLGGGVGLPQGAGIRQDDALFCFRCSNFV